MVSKLQEIIQEAKSEPVLVKILQLLEGILVDFIKKTSRKRCQDNRA